MWSFKIAGERSRNLFISSLLILGLSILSPAQLGATAENHSDKSCCHESARSLDAQELIRKSREFRLLADEIHSSTAGLREDARILLAQAKKANGSLDKLKGRVQEQATASSGAHKLNAQQYASDAKEYSFRLKEFQNHARMYNAHLAEYEKELQRLQAANQSLQASCSQYADHVQRFHVPGIRPPHVCVAMEWEIRAAATAASKLADDQKRTQSAELALAQQEAKLSAAAKERANLEVQLLQKANVNELEQSQGRMLLKEYNELEREYRIIDSAGKRLGVTGKRLDVKEKAK